jgi:hypothetical protein
VDFVASVRVLLRRWYVVVPMLLLTVVGCVAAWLLIAPTYVLKASVLFLNPAIATDPDTGVRNPYVDFGNLTIPARVVSDVMAQGHVREELVDQGAAPTYEVALEGSVSPLLMVNVQADSEAQALLTGELVVQRIGAELQRRQQALNAPPVTYITPEVISPPVEAHPTYASHLRAIAGILGLGGLLSVSAAFLVEAAFSSRRRDEGASQVAVAGSSLAGAARTPDVGRGSSIGSRARAARD